MNNIENMEFIIVVITIFFFVAIICYYIFIVLNFICGEFESKKEFKNSLIPFMMWHNSLKKIWSELPSK